MVSMLNYNVLRYSTYQYITSILFFSFALIGCSSTLLVPDSQLMKEPLPCIYEFDIPADKLWETTYHVLKANGWKIRALSQNIGLMSLYKQESTITSWLSVVIKPSQRGSILLFHSINTMRPVDSDNPDMGKTTVFVSLQSWKPLVQQISNASDGTVVNTW